MLKPCIIIIIIVIIIIIDSVLFDCQIVTVLLNVGTAASQNLCICVNFLNRD